jgi:uncharacterized protein YbjT (DUF2867 family)
LAQWVKWCQPFSLLPGADAVINLVGILYEKGRSTFQAVHVDFPERLAKQAAAAGISRLLHLSALGASPDAPSRYSRSKADGEQVMRRFFPEATILQPSVIFGANDHFFNQFARLSLVAPCLPLIGGGQTKLQPVYVGDVASAVLACLRLPASKGKTYPLAGETTLSLREVYQLTCRYTGRSRRLCSIPFGLASVLGRLLSLLPIPPLTSDMVQSLTTDNTTPDSAAVWSALALQPTALDAVLPLYLEAFRKGGRWNVSV